MKGVILAGGNGTRLRPVSLVTNKHLLPVYDKPMIYYPIEQLKEAGITDVMIITGTEHAGNIFKLLGSGRTFGMNFTYRVQDEAGGIAQAIGLAEDFVGDDKFVVLLGDNIFSTSIRPALEAFCNEDNLSHILLYKVPINEARRLGVAILEDDKVIGFVEKPENPPSDYICPGFYCYTHDVFNVIRDLKPSARGELEITDIHNEYVSIKLLGYTIFDGEWIDAGTIDDLAKATELVKNWRIQ